MSIGSTTHFALGPPRLMTRLIMVIKDTTLTPICVFMSLLFFSYPCETFPENLFFPSQISGTKKVYQLFLESVLSFVTYFTASFTAVMEC